MPSGFDAVYHRYRAFVRRALIRQHVCAADLDDVSQEVFVIVWRKLDGEVDERALRAWLYEVTRRVASNHRRGRGRHARKLSRLTDEPCGMHPHARELARQRLHRVADLVASLDPQQAKIFDWVHLHGVPGRTVAARLGVKLHIAYAQIHALRRDLEIALGASSTEGRGTFAWLALPWARWRWRLIPTGAVAAAIALSRPTDAATPSISWALSEPIPVAREPEPVFAYASRPPPRSPATPRPQPTRPRPRRSERAPSPAPALVVPAAAPVSTFVRWIPPPHAASTSAGPPAPTPGWWTGRFLDEHGRPIAHARVLCRRKVGGRRRPCYRRSVAPHTDADGRARIGPLVPGTYELLAMPSGSSTTALTPTVVRL